MSLIVLRGTSENSVAGRSSWLQLRWAFHCLPQRRQRPTDIDRWVARCEMNWDEPHCHSWTGGGCAIKKKSRSNLSCIAGVVVQTRIKHLNNHSVRCWSRLRDFY